MTQEEIEQLKRERMLYAQLYHDLLWRMSRLQEHTEAIQRILQPIKGAIADAAPSPPGASLRE